MPTSVSVQAAVPSLQHRPLVFALAVRDDSQLWQGAARGERRVVADSMTAVVAALSSLGTEAVTRMERDAAAAALPP